MIHMCMYALFKIVCLDSLCIIYFKLNNLLKIELNNNNNRC